MKKTNMLFIVLLATVVFASGCIGNKADTTPETELGLEDSAQENGNENSTINEADIKAPELIDDENVDLGSLL